ncbi:MAG TPA: hypothetical protein VFQ35_02920 [Polyangiaceae bacterium]|nr:hypothetical protein [Polyangiaceae bacterium]
MVEALSGVADRGCLYVSAVLGLCGCSTLTQISAGPTFLPSSERDSRAGAEVLARAASGFGSEKGFGGIEAVGRAFALGEQQGFSAGLGPAWVQTWGKGWLMFDADAMLGVAYTKHEPWVLGTFRAGLGGGVELSSSTSARPHRLLFGGEPMPGLVEIFHDATALTIDLGPAVDVSGGQSPAFSLGVRIGIAWIELRYTDRDPLDAFTPYGRGRIPFRAMPAPR